MLDSLNRLWYNYTVLWTLGYSQVGKAPDFDSGMRRFESCYPSQYDPLAQPVEHLTFNQGVRSSNLRWVTKKQYPSCLSGWNWKFVDYSIDDLILWICLKSKPFDYLSLHFNIWRGTEAVITGRSWKPLESLAHKGSNPFLSAKSKLNIKRSYKLYSLWRSTQVAEETPLLRE